MIRDKISRVISLAGVQNGLSSLLQCERIHVSQVCIKPSLDVAGDYVAEKVCIPWRNRLNLLNRLIPLNERVRVTLLTLTHEPIQRVRIHANRLESKFHVAI